MLIIWEINLLIVDTSSKYQSASFISKITPKNFKTGPFTYHEEVIIKISSLTNEGIGLGRVDGWVVMVPYTLPGEKVRVRIWCNHKNYSDADLLEVLVSSSSRVEPRCGLFGYCGGCQYQHFTYEQQLIWKTRQIEELFKHQGGVDVQVKHIRPSPREYGYRSKITPHFQKPRKGKLPKIGFQRQGSRRIVDIQQCPIATKSINDRLPFEREKVFLGIGQYRKGSTLLLRDSLDGVVTDHNAVVSQKVGNYLFQFQAGEFFQNNSYILPFMVEHVVSEAQGKGVHYLVDAYCGVGVFCISAAQKFEKVTGIEINASSIHWANANAVVNHIENADFFVGRSEMIFMKVEFEPENTVVIIDPPRRGCNQEFINQLVNFSPIKVVYVSCDPATQVRDLESILAHNYRISCIQPFDLFPHTRHIENIVTLEKYQ